MKHVIGEALTLVSTNRFAHCKVMPWASPIVFFGNAKDARLATVGINPSNREFVDATGRELMGSDRRFPTLSSCGLDAWTDASDDVLNDIYEHCIYYFSNRPYELWFNKLEAVISHTGHSFYSTSRPACHFDLIPFATSDKWAALTHSQRSCLIDGTSNLLREALSQSQIELLVLNGKAVVDCFSQSLEVGFESMNVADLNLNRRSSRSIPGTTYRGNLVLSSENGASRTVRIVGFNHNIQSSFGITREVVRNLSQLIGTIYDEVVSA